MASCAGAQRFVACQIKSDQSRRVTTGVCSETVSKGEEKYGGRGGRRIGLAAAFSSS